MTFSQLSVYTVIMTVITALAGEAHKGTRLDRFLSEQIETLSRSRAKTLVKEGHVRESRAGQETVQEDPRTPVVPGV